MWVEVLDCVIVERFTSYVKPDVSEWTKRVHICLLARYVWYTSSTSLLFSLS